MELGLNHEQQHQELILTDILHALSCNPLLPAYAPHEPPSLRLATPPPAISWLVQEGGVRDVGHGGDGFAFDNEAPRHPVLLQPYRIADRLVHYRRSSTSASANAAFMIAGWERFYAKHGALFGYRLRRRRAETYRAFAALLTDQGQYGAAASALARSLRLQPLAATSWRTAAYVGRRWVGSTRRGDRS